MHNLPIALHAVSAPLGMGKEAQGSAPVMFRRQIGVERLTGTYAYHTGIRDDFIACRLLSVACCQATKKQDCGEEVKFHCRRRGKGSVDR